MRRAKSSRCWQAMCGCLKRMTSNRGWLLWKQSNRNEQLRRCLSGVCLERTLNICWTFSSPPRALVATELGCIERRFSLAIACRLLLNFASQFCAAYVPPRPAVSAL